MSSIEFFIPISPKTYQTQLTRFTGKGGITRVYADPKVKQYKKDIQASVIEYMAKNKMEMLSRDYILEIDITVIFEKGKNWFPGKVPTGGDSFNYTKALCDALEGVLFEDDKDINCGKIKRIYGDTEGLKIVLYFYPKPVEPRKICCVCEKRITKNYFVVGNGGMYPQAKYIHQDCFEEAQMTKLKEMGFPI